MAVCTEYRYDYGSRLGGLYGEVFLEFWYLYIRQMFDPVRCVAPFTCVMTFAAHARGSGFEMRDVVCKNPDSSHT